MRELLRNQAGLTLIELLIAMAIGMIVSAGAYSVFFSTTRTAQKQEQASEMQQNLRVAMERITQDIRQAGFGIPQDGSPVSYTAGTWSSPITVTNNSSAADEITLLGVGYKVGTIQSVSGNDIFVDYDLNGDDLFTGYMEEHYQSNFASTYVSKFLPGGSFTSNRGNLSIGGVEFLAATGYNSMTSAPKGIQMIFPDDVQNFPLNLPVYILQSIRYSIEGCYDSDLDGSFFPADSDESDYLCLKNQDYSELRGNGERVVAEGIEDIQFAYGVDVSPRDGTLDYPSSGYNSAAFVSDPADDSSIVAVRVSIVARSRNPEKQGGSARPALEDRPAGTADRYTRRTLTKTIKLRNPRNGA